tara:strand:- start:296 stop:649 length:354 start_codon:yes stop_codon:yes gene_type:complete
MLVSIDSIFERHQFSVDVPPSIGDEVLWFARRLTLTVFEIAAFDPERDISPVPHFSDFAEVAIDRCLSELSPRDSARFDALLFSVVDAARVEFEYKVFHATLPQELSEAFDDYLDGE